MIKIFTILVLATLAGCASKPATFSAPISNIGVTEHLAKASTSAKVTTDKAKEAVIKGLVANSPQAAALVLAAETTEMELKLTQEANKALTKNILTKNEEAQKLADRLSYIEPKYQASVEIIWKYRMYLAGAAAVIAGLLFWIFKKPIAGAMGFIAGRFAGIP